MFFLDFSFQYLLTKQVDFAFLWTGIEVSNSSERLALLLSIEKRIPDMQTVHNAYFNIDKMTPKIEM